MGEEHKRSELLINSDDYFPKAQFTFSPVLYMTLKINILTDKIMPCSLFILIFVNVSAENDIFCYI